jgi:hypothetical protein
MKLRMIIWYLLCGLTAITNLSAQQRLFTDAGRVKIPVDYRMRPVWMRTYENNNWHESIQAHQMFYPQDEWNSGTLGGYYPAGAIEQVLLPGTDEPKAPTVFGFNMGWAPDSEDRRRFTIIRRRREPIVLTGRDEIPVRAAYYNSYSMLDLTLPTDQSIQLEIIVNTGQTWTHTHWASSNMNFDRSLIHHWRQNYEGITSLHGGSNRDSTVTLPSGQVLTFWRGMMYFAANGRANLLKESQSNHDDDYIDYMESPSRYLSPADVVRAANMQVYYYRDAIGDWYNDWDNSFIDDSGDPLIGPMFANDFSDETGELVSDKMVGTAFFHYDRNGGDVTDLFSLTKGVNHAPSTFLSVGSRKYNESWNRQGTWYGLYSTPAYHKSILREHFETEGANTSGIEWTNITSGAVQSIPLIPHKEFSNGEKWAHIIAGPYTLAPNEDHDIVFTIAVADFPRKESIELGQRYLKWMAQQHPGQHPAGEALPDSVVPMSDMEKFIVLETIKDTLFTVIDKSFTAWHGGPNSGLSHEQKLAGEGLARYPDAPPEPDMFVRGGPDRIDIFAWYPDAAMFDDHDTGVDDFAGWRIYRKMGRPDVNNFDEIRDFGYHDWELVGEVLHNSVGAIDTTPLKYFVPLAADHYNSEYQFADGTTRRVMRFYDLGAKKGANYYYAVSAFDDGSQNLYGFEPGTSLEGDRFQPAYGGLAVTPFGGGPDFLVNPVAVVPNPWAEGAHQWASDPNRIMFDNLPGLCTLKIYTETGDRVTTIEHTNLSNEEYWYMRNMDNQRVESGIYILAVLNGKKVNLVTDEVIGELPDSFVKFVIIR